MAIESYFKNIADAIREKTGGSAVITPGNMPQAIRDITGGLDPISPIHEHFKGGYVASNTYYPQPDETYNSNIYYITGVETIDTFLFLIHYNITQSTDRLRVVAFSQDPYYMTSQTSGGSTIINIDGGLGEYTPMVNQSLNILNTKPYLFVYTGANAINTSIKLYNVNSLYGG